MKSVHERERTCCASAVDSSAQMRLRWSEERERRGGYGEMRKRQPWDDDGDDDDDDDVIC